MRGELQQPRHSPGCPVPLDTQESEDCSLQQTEEAGYSEMNALLKSLHFERLRRSWRDGPPEG
jgi:hypothetical protein